MPASNPGRTGTGNAGTANGVAVLCSPFSGPTGSPFDNDQAGNLSTGALNTGIGFGIGTGNYFTDSAVNGFSEGNFTDNYEPGVSLPGGTAAPDARLTAIGGGRSDPDGTPDPFNAVPLLGFGNGGTRDAGAGPAFTGFGCKTVTATGTVAHGADIEAGFSNRVKVGLSLVSGQSAFGSAAAASAAPV